MCHRVVAAIFEKTRQRCGYDTTPVRRGWEIGVLFGVAPVATTVPSSFVTSGVLPSPPPLPPPGCSIRLETASWGVCELPAEAEEKAKKEREEKEKKKPRPPPPTEPAAMPKVPAKKEGAEGDEMELDEDDLKIIQDTKKGGYCYFKRTLSEKDQSLLDAEQMKLRAVSTPPLKAEIGYYQV